MARLIYESGVAQERPDRDPVTGCWRVIYEREGEGAKFRYVLDEEEEFPDEPGVLRAVVSRAFASRPEYITYAVSKDRHLRLVFTRRVAHQNNLNYFDLHFNVGYHVRDPKVLVERLRSGRDDPLTRLRDVIGDEIGGACRKVAWETLTNEDDFDQVAGELTSAQGEPFRRVEGLARFLGLSVIGISVSLRLLEKDTQDARARIEHEREIVKKKQVLEVTRVNEDIKDEEKLRDLRRSTWEGGAEALTDSLKNIGREVDTGVKLRDTLDTIGLVFPQMNTPGAAAAPLPERPQRMLPDGGNAAGGPLSLLYQVVNLISQLDLRERERRALLAAVFHLAGALLADDEMFPQALSAYRETYRTRLEELMPELDVHQLQTLERLLTAESL